MENVSERTNGRRGRQREETLIDLLYSVDRGLHEHIRVAFRDLEVPFAGMMIIHKVKHEPGVTVSELARQCRMVKSHISKTLEDLSRQGFLEKRPDLSDHRLVRVHLTQAAADLIDRLHGRIRRCHAELIASVPVEKQEALMDGLQILQTALQDKKRQGVSE